MESLEQKMKEWSPDRPRTTTEPSEPPKTEPEPQTETEPEPKAGEKTPQPEAPSELEKRLTAIQSQLSQSQASTQLLNDPQVQEILRAKQAGRSVKVVDSEGTPTGETVNLLTGLKEDELEDMSGKQILELVQKQLSVLEEKKLKPLREESENLKRYMNQQAQERLKAEIATTRGKYKDFDDYRQDMLEIHAGSPNLSVEELYILAKTRAGKAIHPPKVVEPTQGTNEGKEDGPQTSTETERPTTAAGRPSTASTREKPVGPRLRGFDQLMTEALDKHVDMVK